jgi:monofunctional glycosyltransferase
MRRLLYLLPVLPLLWIAWEWMTFPDVRELELNNPESTSFMDRRKRELRREGKDDMLEYEWVSFTRVSPYLRRAVLVSEDNSFYEHEGVDVEGMKEALRKDWDRRRITHGGSTITQQLAKNLYLSPSRSPRRKIKEILIAREMERKLTKKRILELYLNVVELGERVYGAEAASWHYFKKNAASLTPREAALLAGSLPNPRVMNPGDPNAKLRARQRIILSRMRRWGYLVEKQALAPKPQPTPKEEPAPQEPPDETPVIDTSVPESDVPTGTEELPPPTETTATDTTATTETAPEKPPAVIYN